MKARRGGFTVLELLVAGILMTLLIGGALGLAAGVLRHWTREVEKGRTDALANWVFDRLAMDLDGARNPPGTAAAGVTVISGTQAGADTILRFFSDSAGRRTSAGSTRAVAWLCRAGGTGSPFIDDAVPSLFRRVLEPDVTAAGLLPAADGFDWQWIDGEDWSDGLIAPGCMRFGIELLYRERDGRLVPEDPNVMDDGPPAALRITLHLLPDQKIAAFGALFSDLSPDAPRRIEWEHEHIRRYTRILLLRVDADP